MRIVGVVEVCDGGPGRARLAAITDFAAASLQAFIAANIAAGAAAKTDGWPAYEGAPGVAHGALLISPDGHPRRASLVP